MIPRFNGYKEGIHFSTMRKGGVSFFLMVTRNDAMPVGVFLF